MAAYTPLLTLPPSVNSQNSNILEKSKLNCKIVNHTPLESSSFSPPNNPSLLPVYPNSSNYAIAIDCCCCLTFGRQIHAQTLKRGFFNSREFYETRLLYMYSKCGSFLDACQLFDEMPQRGIYSWVGILNACVEHGFNDKALLLFHELFVAEFVLELQFFVFPVVLKACGGIGFVGPGRELHGYLLKRKLLSNIYVSNALIDMYGKWGALDEALKVFNGMEERDCVSWNCMITSFASSGMAFESLKFLERMQSCGDTKPNLISWSAAIASFAQNGYDEEAVGLLGQMLDNGFKPNAQTLASVLPCCGRLEALQVGKEIHGYVVRHGLKLNPFILNGLIDVYSKCGDLGSALEIFLKSSVRNLVSYNAIIDGYCKNGNLIKAKELFYQMELDGVRADTISWNLIISGYCDDGNFEEALKVFREMQEEGIEADSFTLGSVLTACAARAEGKEIHSNAISRGLNSNPFMCNKLIEMYCRYFDFESAEMIFHNMAERDLVTWNLLMSGYARANRLNRSQELLYAMRNDGFEPNIFTWNGLIAGCMENGHNEFVLEMLSELQTAGLKPDIYTIGMIIPVCSRLVSFEQGKQAHSYAIRCGYDTDVHIGAALIDMYAKCGIIERSALSFQRISSHNLVSFNTLFAGYAMHGLRREGLALFQEMLEDGIIPDEISFLSVLSLCVHVGSVEEGLHYFNLMETYDIRPNLKHYSCMVDLHSRAGKLIEAFSFIKSMPMEPDAVIWGALLGGCVVYHDFQLGEIAANRLIELEGDNVSNYVLVANLYATAKRMEDLARIRSVIRNMGMHKSPGWSWIEEKGQTHMFLANDSSHTRAHEIYAAVENLSFHIRMQDEMIDTV
ncbi:hypothetical protein M5K25_016415 [Dendrobium thyrsiflorum]|uniref:Pentatricopeptide repeat-containing protein n=1 Tax=Dendrobium thyrsiflorum TaxID=117978 RepID=A0ABD0UJM5_DENTH